MNSITPNVAAGKHSIGNLKDDQARRDLSRTIGAKVRRRRVELGLTQEKLAEAIGLTFQQIQKYESGANRIAAPRLYQIAQVLQVSPNWFFEHLAGTAQFEKKPTRSCIEMSRLMLSVEPQTRLEILGVVRRIVSSLTKAAA